MSSPLGRRLLYTRRAVQDIDGLDIVVKKRLAKKLEALRRDPLGLAKKLIDPKAGQYRYRVGDYRVVFDMHGASIVVLRVGHRSEIYR